MPALKVLQARHDAIFLIIRLKTATEFIPRSAIGIKAAIVPVTIIAETVCIIMNRSMVSEIAKRIELEAKIKKEEENGKTATLEEQNNEEHH